MVQFVASMHKKLRLDIVLCLNLFIGKISDNFIFSIYYVSYGTFFYATFLYEALP